MIKLVIIFISLLPIIGCVGQESHNETDLQKQELKGKVKSQTKTTYRYNLLKSQAKYKKKNNSPN